MLHARQDDNIAARLLLAAAALWLGLAGTAEALEMVDGVELAPGEDLRKVSVTAPDGRYLYIGLDTSPASIVKFDLQEFERVAVLDLEPGETMLRSAFVDPEGKFAYFGAGTYPAQIIKIDLSDFQRVDALELDAGLESPSSGFVDPEGNYGYFATRTSPGNLVRIDLDLFEVDEVLELPPGERQLGESMIDPLGEFAYLITDEGLTAFIVPPAKVIKVDLNSFSRVDAITLRSAEFWIHTAMMDPEGKYAWLATNTNISRVVRLDLDTFTRLDSMQLPGDDSRMSAGVMDSLAEFAYLGNGAIPARLAKVDLVNLEYRRGIELNEEVGGMLSAVMGPDDASAYFATNTSPGQIIQVDVDGPELRFHPKQIEFGDAVVGYQSSARSVELINPGTQPVVDLLLEEPDGDYLLVDTDCGDMLGAGESCTLKLAFAPGETGARIGGMTASSGPDLDAGMEFSGAGIDDAAFYRVKTRQFPLGYFLGYAGFMHPDGGYAYYSFARSSEPALLAQLNLEEFTFEQTMSFEEEESLAYSGVIDSSGQYAYLGFDSTSIVKVDVANMERVGSISYPDYGGTLLVAVIGRDDRYAYFAGYGSPHRIFKVDLEDFKIVDTLDSGIEDASYRAAVVDPEGEYAYFTYDSPASNGVLKVDLDSFVIDDDLKLPGDAGAAHVALMDQDGSYAIVSKSGGTGSQAFRIDLDSFEVHDSITLEVGGYTVRRGMIEPQGSHAYLATDGAPALLIKIDLDTFEIVGAIDASPFDGSWSDPITALNQPDGEFGYVTYPPNHVVKVRLNAPHLRFEPALIDFCDADLSATVPVMTTSLHNDGTIDATGLLLELYHDRFSIPSSSCNGDLPAMSSCELEIALVNDSGTAITAVHVNTDQLVPARLELVFAPDDPLFEDRFDSDFIIPACQ